MLKNNFELPASVNVLPSRGKVSVDMQKSARVTPIDRDPIADK